MTNSLDDVTGPCLSFGTKHSRPLGTTTKSLTNVATTTNKRDIELSLINVINLICHGKDLTLVNVIDLTSLEDLSLHEVSDASLGHDGDGDGILDFENHGRVGHAGYSPVAADVGGDAFEGHYGDCSGGFGDFGLFDVHYVHLR
jgi:hypothetical protein